MLNTMYTNDLRQTLDHFRRTFDEFFENVNASQQEQRGQRRSFSPTLETAWSDTHLNLRAILPGVVQNDVKVTLNNNQLVIEGERKLPEGWERRSSTQLIYGPFQTALTLPSGLDLDKLTCRMHDGVLDIEIPVSEARRPRQIRIEGSENAPEQKTIDAGKTAH